MKYSKSRLLFLVVSRGHSAVRRSSSFSLSAAAHSGQAADRLGRSSPAIAAAPYGTLCNSREGACGWSSPGLCSGTNSCRVSVVALETARVAELSPYYVWAVEPLRTPGASADAPTTHSGDRLLATGRTVFIVTQIAIERTLVRKAPPDQMAD